MEQDPIRPESVDELAGMLDPASIDWEPRFRDQRFRAGLRRRRGL